MGAAAPATLRNNSSGDPRRAATAEAGGRLVAWLIFAVIIGVLPLARPVSRDFLAGSDVDLDSVFGSGELFIVSGLLAAGAIGEIALGGLRGEDSLAPLIALGACFMCFALNTLAYWSIGVGASGNVELSNSVSTKSLQMFVATLAACASCVWIGAVRRAR
jgi:hypothetical protein